MAKHIFVTGGVVSGLGKGLTASSLGTLLKAKGLRVTLQKLDPYINVDPGTMNPFEHGEVFVTEDGGETDLDLGHYERFIDEFLTRASNATTGGIYQAVLAAERRGDYLGKTVQVIPHITDEIKSRITSLATDDVDIVITEVGGTVGDIEILPFLEAIRQIRLDVGRPNVCYVHVTLVPFIGASGELKTKPTQHSVTELRSRGIAENALGIYVADLHLCRHSLSDGQRSHEGDEQSGNLLVQSNISWLESLSHLELERLQFITVLLVERCTNTEFERPHRRTPEGRKPRAEANRTGFLTIAFFAPDLGGIDKDAHAQGLV